MPEFAAAALNPRLIKDCKHVKRNYKGTGLGQVAPAYPYGLILCSETVSLLVQLTCAIMPVMPPTEQSETARKQSPCPAIVVPVQVMPEGEGLPLPEYQTSHSAGMDLCAAISEPITLRPGQHQLVSTGIRIALPAGYEAQVRARSGLAIKHGITLLNSPGTIDADYRGTVKVILINLGTEPFTINRGDRIAQLIIAPVTRAQWQPVAQVDETTRGPNGFGSTGE